MRDRFIPKWFAALCAAATHLIPIGSPAATLHVSPSAGDSGTGAEASPFRTVAEALEAASKEGGEPVEIVLADGMHPVAETLSIRDRKVPMVIRAAEGATPSISRGVAITGWKVGADGIWEARVSGVSEGGWKFRELFVNGRRATRARFPDEGYFRVEKVGEDKRTRFTFAPDDKVRDWPGLEKTELVFFHDWCSSRIPIKSVEPGSRLVVLRDPVGDAGKHYAMDWYEQHPRYFVENNRGFLTAPGEWFLDSKSGTLSYKPRAGERIGDDLNVIAPTEGALLDVDGAVGFRVTGITFEYSGWDLPGGGYAGVQAAFHQVRPAPGEYVRKREVVPAAVTLDRAKKVVFQNCAFRHLGRSGFWFRKACGDGRVENCRFEDISANGIMVGEHDNAWKPDRPETSSGITLHQNVVTRCGQQIYGSVGIWVGMAAGVTITSNEVSDLPYTGISVGWKWNDAPTGCRGHILADNRIHHIMKVLSDGGGIYTLGRQPGTVIRGNTIHDVSVNAGRAESNGIFFDQGTSELLVEDNTIYGIARSPLRFHQCGKILVRRNRLFRTAEGIPAYRYNNTPEENIEIVENVTPVGDGPAELN